jgi:hypothetical protein
MKMKVKFASALLLLLCIQLTGCATSSNELAPISSIPRGEVREGSLANASLTRDATQAIHKLAKGNQPITKFVIQQPVGQPGLKAWRELWIHDVHGKQQQFILTFREDGKGGANFEVMR